MTRPTHVLEMPAFLLAAVSGTPERRGVALNMSHFRNWQKMLNLSPNVLNENHEIARTKCILTTPYPFVALHFLGD